MLQLNVGDLFKQMWIHLRLRPPPIFLWRASVCVFPRCVTLLTMTPSRPAAEQKVPSGVGSLVRRLSLPSNMVPIETRHKTSCRRTTIIKPTCTSSHLGRVVPASNQLSQAAIVYIFKRLGFFSLKVNIHEHVMITFPE